MNNPYLWNPLPDAAKWLENRIGRPMNVRALVDAVIRQGRIGDPAPTIIKALLPRRLPMAVIAMPRHPDRDALKESITHKQLSAEFGSLPSVVAYIGPAHERVVPLCVNQLLDLLADGDCEIARFETSSLGPNEEIWLMPFAKTAHHATLETCGINERDLLALGELLTQAAPPVPDQLAPTPAPAAEQTPPPEPVQAAPASPLASTKECQEQRQARRYQMCIDAGLEMPVNDYGPWPRGIGAVAKAEGITRQSFQQDVGKYIARLAGKKQA